MFGRLIIIAFYEFAAAQNVAMTIDPFINNENLPNNVTLFGR